MPNIRPLRYSIIIRTTREAVWAALNDPEILKACIPGCQSLTMKSPTELEATVKIKIGPVSAYGCTASNGRQDSTSFSSPSAMRSRQ